jgi:hypothetical protein
MALYVRIIEWELGYNFAKPINHFIEVFKCNLCGLIVRVDSASVEIVMHLSFTRS